MNGLRFEAPIALVLLVMLPALAVVARRRSPSRLTLSLRLAALALVIIALASPTVAGRGGDLTIVFAVDRSASIAATQRRAAEEFVRAAAAQRRRGDRVGLVTFGADALVEEVPSSDPQLAFATQPAPHATDIGAALQAALSVLPSEGAGRIVLLTDGNDNRAGLDDALALARNAGVEISAVPLQAGAGSDVLIDDVVAPAEVRVGEQYTVTVGVVATASAAAELMVTSGEPSSVSAIWISSLGARSHLFRKSPARLDWYTIPLLSPQRPASPLPTNMGKPSSWCAGPLRSGTSRSSRVR